MPTEPEDPSSPKRVKVMQSEFPNAPLEQVLRLPQAIWDNFAGKGAAPLRVAMAVGIKPSSGPWRNLCGSAMAYGLTDGGYNAAQIACTPLGLKIVRPTTETDTQEGLREAILKPRIQREFLEKYNNAKFPKDMIAHNVLVDLGLPKERGPQALAILKSNAELAGVLADIRGDKFVFLGGTGQSHQTEDSPHDVQNEVDDIAQLGLPSDSDGPTEPISLIPLPASSDAVTRVFVTHGKNQKVLGHIEKIVRLGGFEPVIAKNVETAAKPVPDKVLDEMRSCQAAVIHVGVDGVLFDKNG
jgi:hypothetical protein